MGNLVRFPSTPSHRRETAGVARRTAPPYNDPRVPRQVATIAQAGEPFLVGTWRVEPSINRLVRGGIVVQLEHKAMDVLLCLADRAGELVAKHDLLDVVWETEFVADNTLQRRVAELREALGDSAASPRYIETIRKRGYRLIAPVGPISDGPAEASVLPDPQPAADDIGNPYPGLAPFTERDGELFFGREREAAALWRTISSRRLVAVIGPSGVGKSSLLRAGVAGRPPPGWRVVVLTPGDAPVFSLARALAPDHAGDPSSVSRLVGFTDPDIALAAVSRWRGMYVDAVLIVDQFEEVFTLTPFEVQSGFIELLRRLVDAADVHVVLGLRDDFLHRCQQFREISPIFKELTPLGLPTPDGLRRALVEPAARRLHRFESEVLVDRMVVEAGDRPGALPLLAFAVHRMWLERDRERRLLTEEAYEAIGGVAGALARHAESTMARLSDDRLPVVREIFRNLVTADGTRAARDVDELLSVFERSALASDGGMTLRVRRRTPHSERSERSPLTPDSERSAPRLSPGLEAAEEVLRELVDARLLTAYETNPDADRSRRRVEIAHESLLSAWPRLVRWRTRDADAAQLRDQLRRAAQTWHERGRPDDLLWTGSAYREYRVWREHYPGGLSDTEEGFAAAMVCHATRRLRRRVAFAATVVVSLLFVMATLGIFWRRSAAEARRAEAASLFSLAQSQLGKIHAHALAYATASLELSDTPEVRRLALDALWRGPTVLVIPSPSVSSLDFGADGRWLATAGHDRGGVLWPEKGWPPLRLENSEVAWEIALSPRGDVVATNIHNDRRELRLWSLPDGRYLRALDLPEGGRTLDFHFSPDGGTLYTSTETDTPGQELFELVVRAWPTSGGDAELVARLELPPSSVLTGSNVNPNATRFSWAEGRLVHVAPMRGAAVDWDSTVTVRHDAPVSVQRVDFRGRQLLSASSDGWVRIWSLLGDRPELTHEFLGMGHSRATSGAFDRTGSRVICGGGYLWDLSAPPDSRPLRLNAPGGGWGIDFHPNGRWAALGDWQSTFLWPLSHAYPLAFPGHESLVYQIEFSPDGRHLVSAADDGTVRLWPIERGTTERARVLDQVEGVWRQPWNLAMAPDGSFVATGSRQGRIAVVPLDGRPVAELLDFTDVINAPAVGPRSRFIAAAAGTFKPDEAVVRVWDLDTGSTRVLDSGDGAEIDQTAFTADGDLWVAIGATLRRWKLAGGPPEVVETIDLSTSSTGPIRTRAIDPEDRRLLRAGPDGRLWIEDFDGAVLQELAGHSGSEWSSIDWRAGVVVSDDPRGGIRVGRFSDPGPHLLLGYDGRAQTAAISPDGRRIASGHTDGTIRLWPMPDLDEAPLHTLPREELIAKLETLTNLRAVRDPSSSTGWRIEIGPFPGWETVPSW